MQKLIQREYPDIIIGDERESMFGSNDCNSFLYGPGIVDYTIINKNDSEVMGDTENYLMALPSFKNIVIDSGGFNSISKIAWYPENSILTPHVGELKRIFNLKDDKICVWLKESLKLNFFTVEIILIS